jgi:hypothetical protein
MPKKHERDPKLGFISQHTFTDFLQANCTLVVKGKTMTGKLTAAGSGCVYLDGKQISQKDIDSIQ